MYIGLLFTSELSLIMFLCCFNGRGSSSIIVTQCVIVLMSVVLVDVGRVRSDFKEAFAESEEWSGVVDSCRSVIRFLTN